MKRVILLILLGLPLVTSAAPTDSRDNTQDFYIPWKPLKRELYKEKSSLETRDSAGLSISDFFSVEGSRYDFDYFQRFRYSPVDRKGFTQESSQTYNFLGVGKIPLSKTFTFFGKIGPSYYQPGDDTFDNELFPTIDASYDWAISYSTGASIKLSPRLQLSMEYMRTENGILELESSIAQMRWNF